MMPLSILAAANRFYDVLTKSAVYAVTIRKTDTGELIFLAAVYVGLPIIVVILTSFAYDMMLRGSRTSAVISRDSEKLPEPKYSIAIDDPWEFKVEKPHYITVDSSKWFIMNNMNQICLWIKKFSPSFEPKAFMEYAKTIFARFAEVRDTALMSGRVSADVEAVYLPDRIEKFGNCFMHNYILTDGHENLKLYMSVPDKNGDDSGDGFLRYFLTFSKRNPLVDVSEGQFLSITCPNCGGIIEMKKDSTSECPFCGGTVTFAEADWVLTELEFIGGQTLICNDAFIRSY